MLLNRLGLTQYLSQGLLAFNTYLRSNSDWLYWYESMGCSFFFVSSLFQLFFSLFQQFPAGFCGCFLALWGCISQWHTSLSLLQKVLNTKWSCPITAHKALLIPGIWPCLPLDVYLLCQPHTVLPSLKDFNVISMVVFNSIEFLSSEWTLR